MVLSFLDPTNNHPIFHAKFMILLTVSLGSFLGGFFPSFRFVSADFTLKEDDMKLKDGEDMNAAVDRVMQGMIRDHQTDKATKYYEKANPKEGNKYNEKEDDAYFKSYEDIDVHRTMIMDGYRTDMYRNALLRDHSSHFFRQETI